MRDSAMLNATKAIEPRLKRVGERFAVLPIPLTATFGAAMRVLLAVSLNVTLMLQFAPAANELLQLWVLAKLPALVPVITMPVIVHSVVPVLTQRDGFGFASCANGHRAEGI
jgi:hypothetical protein